MGFTTIPDRRIIEWTSRFVAWPSEQTALMEDDPAIRGFIAGCVRPLVRDCGFESSIDPAGNLHLVAGPAGAPLRLAMVTYAMTHPRSTMEDPFSGKVEGGGRPVIRGRGSSEQKGAMAAALAAFLDVIANEDLRSRMAFLVLTAGETGRHDAIAHALRALPEPPRNAILALGTDGRISLGNRGRLDIEVTITGIPAHSSTPWAGRDVTRGVAAVLEAAARLSAQLRATGELGPATLTCTSIGTSPMATHTVQSQARMTFDRRLLPEEDVDAVFGEIVAAFRASCDLEIDVARGPFMHGARMDGEAPFVRFIKKALSTAGEEVPALYHSHGALDAGYLTRLGIAAVMWGPGNPDLFHTPDEHVGIDQLLYAARAYRAVISGMAAGVE